MTDLKIITMQNLLPVTQISYAQGITPLSIRLIGSKFFQAQEVLINSSPAPEFIAVSDQEILAQIPAGMEAQVIRQVAVLTDQPFADLPSMKIQFGVGRTFKRLQGLERLVQLFCKILLQKPGSDCFRPSLGGGLFSILGQTTSQDGTALASAVSQAVSQTRDQILSMQNKIPRIPPDERLLQASTDAVGFQASTTTLAARISLAAVSGQQAVANLTF